MTYRGLTAIVFCACVAGAPSAHAQSGDAAVETAASAPPPADAPAPAVDEPTTPRAHHSFFGRMRAWARDARLFERMNGDVPGWYPRIGGVTRGSGLAGGAGYRVPLFNDTLLADVSAAMSIKTYTAIDAKLRVLQSPARRVELWSEFRVENFPQEDYYGLGMATSRTARTSYDLDSTDLRARLLITPRRWARVTTLVGYWRPDVGHGRDTHYPSIEDLFTDVETPGLIAQPSFLHTTVTGEIDYRDTGGNTSRGGFYRASFGVWNDVTFNAYNFQRVDVHAAQFVPLTRSGAHVVSARVGAVAVNAYDGSRVPFYALAYVGGMDTVRSLPEFRFKDRNAVWLSGEYKWRPRPFFSISAFADVGQVSPDWHSLRTRDMDAGYGAGVAIHSTRQTILRLDLGMGAAEGWQLFIKLRPLF